MAIKITENGVVNYENSPDVNRKLFPNLNICGKEINELADEIDGKAPLIVNTASGSIASFDNGADDLPMKSAVVSIEPIQEGTGDPSPENVRPISGRTGLSVVRSGKNLLPMPIVSGSYDYTTTITVNDDKSFVINKTISAGWSAFILGRFTLKPGTYTLIESDDNNANSQLVLDKVIGDTTEVLVTTRYTKRQVFTVEADTLVQARYTRSGIADNVLTKLMLFIGNTATATDYEPYKGSTYSVNWETEAGTVYGGALDVVSGKLTVDKGYIASYNEETLPSTWISDRDAYAPGTTPTIGAQVVYKLAEPIEYQLTPQEIRTLPGVNNIWSDAGDVSVESPADTKTYIDELSIKTVEVSGQSPTITAEKNTRYICGEVTSLTFTPCETGICDVRFTATSISTVLTLPETVKLPDWFDPTLLEANTTYEINIVDGIYGVVMSWA